ncbi:DUF3160 domain-containing protein [candidate division KSB1 bacterium]|nr:DUF3160 domain-containing protein [candidate division KSB1 bacterium]
MIRMFYLILFLSTGLIAGDQMIADILQPVQTDFGTYVPVLVDITPMAKEFSIQPDFRNVENFSHGIFTETDLNILRQYGFVVKPRSAPYHQIHQQYMAYHDDEIPAFITSDAVLHAFHLLYDNILKALETERFTNDLSILLQDLMGYIQVKCIKYEDLNVKRACGKLLAYLTVASVLLDETTVIPADTKNLVDAEIDLVNKHAGYSYSPIFDYLEDYSQYIPRGHYTQTEALQKYFRAMMWLGRITFTMEPDNQPDATREHTLMALMLIDMLVHNNIAGNPALNYWHRIYDPTVFFVGKSDDINVYQYKSIADSVYHDNYNLEDFNLLEQFIERANKLQGPLITSPLPGSTPKGFRFMGQRFIPDSYMFDRLTAPTVPGRLMPRGLDIMAVLGSDRARDVLDSVYHESTNICYIGVLDSLSLVFENKPDQQWAENLYWNWLYSLMPLLFTKGKGYPAFMQTLAWQDKDLATSLGSWSELRHDTILYAKQSSSWESIPPVPVLIKGYVEPNPHLFARLAALAQFMVTGLNNRELLNDTFEKKLNDLKFVLMTLKNIAEKELLQQTPTTNEYYMIQRFGHIMDQIVTFPSLDPENPEGKGQDLMAVIADVHTDALNFKVLQVGVGYPMELFVIVPIEDKLKITRGAIFSYYEFLHPMSDRLTDEKWRELLLSDKAIKPLFWSFSYTDTTQNFQIEYLIKKFDESATKVSQTHKIHQVKDLKILPNYPNPFNPQTTVSFYLPKSSHVRIEIYNINGKLVRLLIDENHPNGVHHIIWDGKTNNGQVAASGIYVIFLKTPYATCSHKITLLQ